MNFLLAACTDFRSVRFSEYFKSSPRKKDWLDTLFDKRGHANRKLGHLALFAVEEAKGPAVLGKRPRAHPEARPTCPTGSPCSSASLALGA